ncbi:MAG: DUF4157 domain-containing protein [Planctomycetia bacterium]|nr:DUF4157 domain-containing protein [Planctomycetia bacterium]
MLASSRCGIPCHPAFLQGELPSRWRTPFERSFGCDFSRVRVESGPAVDADLARRQAVGRALTPDRIALASTLAFWPETLQRFVVGHELAHTVQLARGGSTPVPQLEAEADRAALAALRGATWTIRGCAAQPLNMMTTAISIVSRMPSSDKALASASKHYYNTFRYEPSGGKLVGKTPGPGKGREAFRWLSIYWDAQELANINLFDVLSRAAEYALTPNGAVLIECHGDPDGLSIPLIPGGLPRKIGPTGPTSIIDYLTCRHKKYSDDAAAYGMFMYEYSKSSGQTERDRQRAVKQLQTMRQKIDILRAKQLRHVAFRACQVGKNPAALNGLKELFGAEHASAPKLRTFFGYFNPAIDDSAETWNEVQGLDSKWQVFGAKPNRFAVLIKGKDPNAGNKSVAECRAAVTSFVENYYPPAYNYQYKKGLLYYQVFWDPAAQRIYFPQEAEYVQNLLYDESAPKRPYAKLAP